MNLSLLHKLLIAAEQHRHGILEIQDRHLDREVRLMASAGLVEATLGDNKNKSFTIINRLTDLGRAFLRTFEHAPVPALGTAAEKQSDSRAAVRQKWNANFALDLRRPKQTD
jgi:hypothetical protein